MYLEVSGHLPAVSLSVFTCVILDRDTSSRWREIIGTVITADIMIALRNLCLYLVVFIHYKVQGVSLPINRE